MFAKLVPNYVIASIAVAIGGFLNGYDTGSIGAIMEMDEFKKAVGHLSPFLVGFTVSLIMLTAAIPSIFAGQLADSLGRIKVISLGALLFGIGAAIEGSSNGLPQFLVGRAIAGLGEGVYLSNVSVYICEIAPYKHRGILAGLPQFMATAGVCIGYFTCYGTIAIQSTLAWRVPYIIQCLLTILFIASCIILPDSPRWLMTHGRRQEALTALSKLDFSMVEAERDFLTVTEQRSSLSPWQSFLLLFRRGYRSRTILALFILGMVQLSGIDGVLYYAPVLFSQAGLSSSTASFLASGVSAILMLAISIPAFLLADKWGRRTSAITGGIGLSGLMLLIGTLYAAGVVHSYGVARWVVIVCVFAFGLTYCATWGIVGKIYASEIQPSNTRAAANCVAQGLGFFTNWLVAILTPILLDKSAFGAYFLFGGLALGTVAVLAAYMPETRGRTLEEIQHAFHQPGLKSLTRIVRRRARRDPGHSSQAIEMDTPLPTTVAEASGRGSLTGLRLNIGAV
ncbi:general substrate transporter [Truncatella angustata]|uniref:General substrate transporter n=1 Tax=Truncatella angustata TaxID=152316 RepID=A0A9P8UHH3_9PEZI|nr:general substrate transporter [Truncatella angustata]KAH6652271.1 general substrate transporter [Truncatella angustata]